MKAPVFIRIRADAEAFSKLLSKDDEVSLSFGRQRQREITYVVEDVAPLWIELRKKYT